MKDLRIVRTVECARRQRRALGFSAVTVAMSFLLVGLCVRDGVGRPPEYKSFGRRQRIDYNPDQDDLMRIWVVYVVLGGPVGYSGYAWFPVSIHANGFALAGAALRAGGANHSPTEEFSHADGHCSLVASSRALRARRR